MSEIKWVRGYEREEGELCAEFRLGPEWTMEKLSALLGRAAGQELALTGAHVATLAVGIDPELLAENCDYFLETE